MSICKRCQEVADTWTHLIGNANHDPSYCEDADLDKDLPYGHGCPCQHNKGVVPHGQAAGPDGAGTRTP